MSNQPRMVDIHAYYRTGGTDWDRVKLNFDVVGIRACVGDQVDELLEEHVDACRARKIPYLTYCVPSASIDPLYQADFYLDQYGVLSGLASIDQEPTGGVMTNEYQSRKLVERVDAKHPAQCWYYSNHYYTNQLGYPQWIRERPVWWAEYRYQYLTYKYREFEPFLEKYRWWQPKWAAANAVTVTVHQFTDKGDAQLYLANPTTNDPDYKTGIKSADLNVALIDRSELLAYWNVFGAPPPLTDAEKLALLWNAHPELH